MTYDEFDQNYTDQFWLFNYHMNYIMDNNDPSERSISNGDSLIEAAEAGYLYEEFRDYWIEKNRWVMTYKFG
jgi:hypothetical protein